MPYLRFKGFDEGLAALAMGLVEAGIKILNKTFAQAGVSEVVCWQKSTETKRRK